MPVMAEVITATFSFGGKIVGKCLVVAALQNSNLTYSEACRRYDDIVNDWR